MFSMFKRLLGSLQSSYKISLVTLLLIMLTACGGGSDSETSFVNDPTDSTGTTEERDILYTVETTGDLFKDGQSQALITVTLENQTGTPYQNILVRFSFSGVSDFSPTQAYTDANGEVQAVLTTTVADAASIIATAFFDTDQVETTIDVSYADIYTTSLATPSYNAATGILQTQASYTGYSYDTQTQSFVAYTNSIELETVYFEAITGVVNGITCDDPNNVTLDGATTASTFTDSNGLADIVFNASEGGDYCIAMQAATNGATYTEFVISTASVIPPNLGITLDLDSPAQAGEGHVIYANVTDAGVAVEGQEVTFSAIDGVVSIDIDGDGIDEDVFCSEPSNITFNPVTQLTESNGDAKSGLVASQAGSYCIKASVGDISAQGILVVGVEYDISLSTDALQIGTASGEQIIIDALVRDTQNNVVNGETINFVADNDGILTITQNPTVDGFAQAVLEMKTFSPEQTVTVTAQAASASASATPATITIDVEGNTLSSSTIPQVLEGGQREKIDVLLVNSDSVGIPSADVEVTVSPANLIELEDPDGNTGSTISLSTDLNGERYFYITGSTTSQGTATLELSSSYDNDAPSIQKDVEVSNVTFALNIASGTVNPNNLDEIQLDITATGSTNTHILEITWTKAGVPVVGEDVEFTTTRGTLDAIGSIVTKQTDVNGQTTAELSSTTAGEAIVTITGNDPNDNDPSITQDILFVAFDPFALDLKANPTTLGVEDLQGNNQSKITATVLDADGNPVKDQTISFTLDDVSGGRLSAGTAVTDRDGLASITYFSGSLPSGKDAVVITAEIVNSKVAAEKITLTVTEDGLFVRLGIGDDITTIEQTIFGFPFGVEVTDGAGNGVAEQEVEILATPTTYYKGRYFAVVDESGNFLYWSNVPYAAPFNPYNYPCPNEDLNLNGILDFGEDTNSNGQLDPGNIMSVPATVTTLASPEGWVEFEGYYLRENATWIDIDLEARLQVSGTEARDIIPDWRLPITAEDIESPDSFPAIESPYGTSRDCTCSIQAEKALENGCYGLDSTSIDLNQGNITVNYNDYLPLVAVFEDEEGNPIAGDQVLFGFSINSSGGSINNGVQAYAVTNADGIAIATYKAGTQGSNIIDTIYAQSSVGNYDLAQVTVLGTTESEIRLTLTDDLGEPSTLVTDEVDQGDIISLSLLYIDATGAVIPNANITVSFAENQTGANINKGNSVQVTTDIEGIATFDYQAGSTNGQDILSATTGTIFSNNLIIVVNP